ncbi:MAG: tRNA pseudouridine(55) synthase TruB [Candidatus Margulisiibacteriota bacterium]
MDGIIIVDKPIGWTSFDVCAKIRNLSMTKKVGHSGTLDPMATGVLPVFLGKATKSIQQFLDGDKGYLAEVTLGFKTDTGDATGKPVNPKSQIPNPKKEEIIEILKKYTGEIEQVPPMFSAVKINGQRLYKLARQGIEVERKPRKIKIYELRMTHYDSQDSAAQHFTLLVLCSKGTYIRQLATDIGDDLGCGAHLSALQRTFSQPFHISQALSMDTIVNLAKIGKLDSVVLKVEDILSNENSNG